MTDSEKAATAQEKRVTWVELFFDLVFVFAVTQVSGVLHADHSPAGIARALIVFVPTYWAWVGTTMHANLHEVDRLLDRLGIFAIGLCGLFMALALPSAYRAHGLLFGASYWAARLVLFPLVQHTYRSVGFNSFTAAAFVSGPLLVLGGLVEGNARAGLWAVAAAIDLLVPYLARARLARVPYEPSHLAERFGLFVIIALGESVVAIGVAATDQTLTGSRLTAVAIGFALNCALWWVYFVFAASVIRYRLVSAEVAIEVIRPVLPYGHLGFIAGIIAIAAGIGAVIVAPTAHLHTDTAGLLFGGAAVYLTTFGYTRWQMFHTLATPRLAAAAASLALLPFARHVPAVACVAALTAVLTGLNLFEARTIPRTRLWSELR